MLVEGVEVVVFRGTLDSEFTEPLLRSSLPFCSFADLLSTVILFFS